MSEAPFWGVLGIAPTTADAEIRRAYAARLRLTHPEDDPEGFKALREAYEWALGYARFMAAQEAADRQRPDETDVRLDEDVSDRSDRDSPGDARVAAKDASPLADGRADPDDGLARERELHSGLCNRLIDRLRASAPPAECLEALDEVLASPAMAQLDTYARTEFWLADVLAAARPASDELIPRAIAFFQWERDVGADRHGAAARMIYLNERVKAEKDAALLLKRISNKKHEYHRAYEETMRPPSARSWLGRLIAIRHAPRVIEFLHYVQGWPVVMESLNQEAVQWWTKRLPVLRVINRGLGVVQFVAVCAAALGFVLMFSESRQPPSGAERPVQLLPAGVLPQAKSGERLPDKVMERVPVELREPVQRLVMRRDCSQAIEQLRHVSSISYNPILGTAEAQCEAIVKMTPESLLMHQYAGIAALRARRADVALGHFERILESAPNDAYALYGKGLVALAGPEGARLGNLKDISDALAINPDVAKYFDDYQLTAPDVAPSAKKPRSRLPKRQPVPRSEEAKQISNPQAPTGTDAGKHFGFDKDVDGDVTLDCLIGADGALHDCFIESEKPANIGLGEAGLFLAKGVRFKPATLDGAPVDKLPLHYTITFAKSPPKTPDAGKPDTIEVTGRR